MITTYNYGEPLYYNVFMTRSLINELSLYLKPLKISARLASFRLEITLEDKYTTNLVIDVSDNHSEVLTSLPFALHDKEENRVKLKGLEYTYQYQYQYFKDFIAQHEKNFKIGENKVEFKLFPKYAENNSEKLEDDVLDKEKIKPIASGILKINFKKNIVDPNDSDQCMPTPEINDVALEKAVIQAVKDYGEEAPLKVSLLREGWIDRNKYSGVILAKIIHAYVGIRKKDGSCMKSKYRFAYRHEGTRFSDTLIYAGYESYKQAIACGCLE